MSLSKLKNLKSLFSKNSMVTLKKSQFWQFLSFMNLNVHQNIRSRFKVNNQSIFWKTGFWLLLPFPKRWIGFKKSQNIITTVYLNKTLLFSSNMSISSKVALSFNVYPFDSPWESFWKQKVPSLHIPPM